MTIETAILKSRFGFVIGDPCYNMDRDGNCPELTGLFHIFGNGAFIVDDVATYAVGTDDGTYTMKTDIQPFPIDVDSGIISVVPVELCDRRDEPNGSYFFVEGKTAKITDDGKTLTVRIDNRDPPLTLVYKE